MKAVLVTLKSLDRAKQRLRNRLRPGLCRELARAMWQDVSVAVEGAREADQVVLLSSDPWACQEAERRKWVVLREGHQVSESDSVDWASRVLSEMGVECVLRIPSDLPLIEPEDIDSLLSVALPGTVAVAVPSRDGTGTNALLRQPPLAFPSRFGPGSLELHQREACSRGVPLEILENQRISFDVDLPEDLGWLVRQGSSDLASWRLIMETGLAQQVKQWEDDEPDPD